MNTSPCLLLRSKELIDFPRRDLSVNQLSDLNNFHLQVVEVRIIEVELALERPVRDAAALAEQREDLIQYRVKVHDQSSMCLPGSAQTAPAPWGPWLRFQAPARNAARQRQNSEKHTMTGAKAYQKHHTKARRRRYRTAHERLARDRRQAQHAAEALHQALDDLGFPKTW